MRGALAEETSSSSQTPVLLGRRPRGSRGRGCMRQTRVRASPQTRYAGLSPGFRQSSPLIPASLSCRPTCVRCVVGWRPLPSEWFGRQHTSTSSGDSRILEDTQAYTLQICGSKSNRARYFWTHDIDTVTLRGTATTSPPCTWSRWLSRGLRAGLQGSALQLLERMPSAEVLSALSPLSAIGQPMLPPPEGVKTSVRGFHSRSVTGLWLLGRICLGTLTEQNVHELHQSLPRTSVNRLLRTLQAPAPSLQTSVSFNGVGDQVYGAAVVR